LSDVVGLGTPLGSNATSTQAGRAEGPAGEGRVAMRIDLNADLGEGYGPWSMGDDEAMLGVVTTANVACGMHAGDPDTMRRTLEVAKRRGVAVGAHPGFDDRIGFGRRLLPDATPAKVEALVAYQVGAMMGIAALVGIPVRHVKAHGALANVATVDDALADAVARAVRAVDPGLALMVMPGTAAERSAERVGLRPLREIYADRTYDDDFTLTARSRPGAVIHDVEAACTRVLATVAANEIVSTGGRRLSVGIDTICVHGDNPAAVGMARTLRSRLEGAGWTVVAPA
jgi:UPF0271 protein